MTGVLIAAAEANGCLALIMFIAGPGQFGVGPFSGATTSSGLFSGLLRAPGCSDPHGDRPAPR